MTKITNILTEMTVLVYNMPNSVHKPLGIYLDYVQTWPTIDNERLVHTLGLTPDNQHKLSAWLPCCYTANMTRRAALAGNDGSGIDGQLPVCQSTLTATPPGRVTHKFARWRICMPGVGRLDGQECLEFLANASHRNLL